MGSLCDDEAGLEYEAPASSLQRKREQVVQACERCRRSRLKCDTERPCRRCTRVEEECVDGQGKRKRGGGSKAEGAGTSGGSWVDLLSFEADVHPGDSREDGMEGESAEGLESLDGWLE
eukprot:744858-Hanusia_phi.AAC.1